MPGPGVNQDRAEGQRVLGRAFARVVYFTKAPPPGLRIPERAAFVEEPGSSRRSSPFPSGPPSPSEQTGGGSSPRSARAFPTAIRNAADRPPGAGTPRSLRLRRWRGGCSRSSPRHDPGHGPCRTQFMLQGACQHPDPLPVSEIRLPWRVWRCQVATGGQYCGHMWPRPDPAATGPWRGDVQAAASAQARSRCPPPSLATGHGTLASIPPRTAPESSPVLRVSGDTS